MDYERSFCNCHEKRAQPFLLKTVVDIMIDVNYQFGCVCGEVSHTPAWSWSSIDKTHTVLLDSARQQVTFHKLFSEGYSTGNACVRGDTPFVNDNHYFWELKLLTPVFGTSVMIGVGTENVLLDKYANTFCHFLGDDEESWGLFYGGTLHHNKDVLQYHPKAGFCEGSIIGVHLDMWNGTLGYFLNREFLGIAFRGLRNKTLYPIVSATASKLSMRLVYSTVRPHSLLFQLLQSITPDNVENLPHGLKREASQCWWHFPKSSKKEGRKNVFEDPSRFNIYLLIDGDDEDDDQRALMQRMKRVLENSSCRRAHLHTKRIKTDIEQDKLNIHVCSHSPES